MFPHSKGLSIITKDVSKGNQRKFHSQVITWEEWSQKKRTNMIKDTNLRKQKIRLGNTEVPSLSEV